MHKHQSAPSPEVRERLQDSIDDVSGPFFVVQLFAGWKPQSASMAPGAV